MIRPYWAPRASEAAKIVSSLLSPFQLSLASLTVSASTMEVEVLLVSMRPRITPLADSRFIGSEKVMLSLAFLSGTEPTRKMPSALAVLASYTPATVGAVTSSIAVAVSILTMESALGFMLGMEVVTSWNVSRSRYTAKPKYLPSLSTQV
jgi:hypothetical protein